MAKSEAALTGQLVRASRPSQRPRWPRGETKMTARFLMSMLTALLVWAPISSSFAEVDDTPALIPSLGIPYATTTGSGDPFFGTVEIDVFESTGDGLVARGLLRFGRRAEALAFPVEVLRADCPVLELEVGPPNYRGLQDPLVIFETPDSSELRQADFCRNAEALAAGDFDELASLLNEEALLAAGFLGGSSCPWYQKLSCGSAIAACSSQCAVNAQFCTACLATIGLASCFDCLR